MPRPVAQNVVASGPLVEGTRRAPAAPASDRISTASGTTRHGFGASAADQSSQYSAMGEAGVMG